MGVAKTELQSSQQPFAKITFFKIGAIVTEARNSLQTALEGPTRDFSQEPIKHWNRSEQIIAQNRGGGIVSERPETILRSVGLEPAGHHGDVHADDGRLRCSFYEAAVRPFAKPIERNLPL